MTHWLADQTAQLEGLVGRSVTEWHAVEMALRELAPNQPQFSDPTVPCLQLVSLQATLTEGLQLNFDTYQDDANFGLRLSDGRLSDRAWTGIYRQREVSELPVGLIEDSSVRIDEGVISELNLTVAQTPMLLMAAEIYENLDGTLEWHRNDESILAFRSPADANDISWLPTRPRVGI